MPLGKRAQLLGLLVEGNSLRAAARLADVSFNTALKFVADMGKACRDYQDGALRELPCKRIQVDEIWAFVGAKQRNATEAQKSLGYGDIWTWTAIDADTKLAVSWLVGGRDAEYAEAFLKDVVARIAGHFQLTSDGHNAYLRAVENLMTDQFDYAQLVKMYGESPEGQRRYSPAICVGAKRQRVLGRPDPAHISTSFVERQNLTMRMGMRRFTRLSNGFSKKAENHAYAVATHFMWYNFGRVHKT
jgi:IS1 family transposase